MNESVDSRWLQHPSHQIVKTMDHIYRYGLTTTSGGNVSVMEPNGDMWITPASVDKGSLTPDDIVCIRADGTVHGKHKPSSEHPFHKAVYSVRPDLKAIIHAHPPALVSFSIVHRIPDTAVMRQVAEVCGSAGYAEYDLPGSSRLGEKVAAEFSRGYNVVIMESHAAVAGGNCLDDALIRFVMMEYCARTIHSAETIGIPVSLTRQQIEELQPKAFMEITDRTDHHLVMADEQEARTEICNIVRRACLRGVMFSSCGTVSVRWHGRSMLVTPAGKLLDGIAAEDIVLVDPDRLVRDNTEDCIAGLHSEIYRRHPSVNAVITAQPPYLMAFAVTGKAPDVRTIPESWIFLQEIPSVPFGSQLPDRNEIHDLLSNGTAVMLIQNDSALVTGTTLLQALDRLEIAELTATSLVLAGKLGRVVPINDQQIKDLRNAYLK